VCGQRQMNFDLYRGKLPSFNFWFWVDNISNIKTKILLIWVTASLVFYDTLWKTLENCMRHFRSIHVSCLSYFTHELCSKQYSVRHVFMSINCCNQQEVFSNLNYILWNHFTLHLFHYALRNTEWHLNFYIPHVCFQGLSTL
jgi:hypothetical protein